MESLPTAKTCTKCKISKPLEEFNKHSRRKFGKRHCCKICDKEDGKKYRQENKEKVKQNKLKWNQNNREKNRIRTSKYYQKNSKAINARTLLCYQTNPTFRMKHNIKTRMRLALKGIIKKSASTEKLLGCSFNKAKSHIESQFQTGMTWENHGKYGWHIDHIKPCASFDLSNPDEQKICFHYTNLQPLWAKDNLAKGDRILEVGV